VDSELINGDGDFLEEFCAVRLPEKEFELGLCAIDFRGDFAEMESVRIDLFLLNPKLGEHGRVSLQSLF